MRKDELEAATHKLCALLTEGLNSPPSDRPWSELLADLLQRAQQHLST